MRNTQDLKNFVHKWSSEHIPNKQILYEYMPFCSGLLYEDEDLVRETTNLLRRNILQWKIENCPKISSVDDVISKDHLIEKSGWYVDSMMHESQPMATSGSTNGLPFEYRRWEPFLYFIEGQNHYDMILDEFGTPDRPKIMYFFNTSMYDKSLDVTVRDDSFNFMEHHGTKRRAEVHYPNFKRFQESRDEYLSRLSYYLMANKMDVIFAPGPTINALCSRIKKVYKWIHKFAELVSNSNERLLPEDANFLLMGYAANVCDHMRCWDGGAGFWTCKHGTYHLMDNLSWCEEIDGKLISTDYFSLPCPFVRYWNGDFCRITDTYSRCECGRLYRDFEFLENRPFAVKGRSILEIRETISKLGLKQVKRVTCSTDRIIITSFSEIPEHKKQMLRNRHHLEFDFLVER